ncbi:hypothetical protein ACRZ5S_22960 (plasmid) [Vibrio scophthalmi]|uniref:hypothetical protein n=1 Tax=Vibrio scophthalmi TaxID=45658 RepID=UPI003EBF9C9E
MIVGQLNIDGVNVEIGKTEMFPIAQDLAAARKVSKGLMKIGRKTNFNAIPLYAK